MSGLRKGSFRVHQSAMTYVELVMAVALLLVIAALAVPSFRGSFEKARRERTAEDLVALLDLAHVKAAVAGAPREVLFDAASRRFIIDAGGDDGTAEGTGQSVRHRTRSRADFLDIPDPIEVRVLGQGWLIDGDGTLGGGDACLCEGDECLQVTTRALWGRAVILEGCAE